VRAKQKKGFSVANSVADVSKSRKEGCPAFGSRVTRLAEFSSHWGDCFLWAVFYDKRRSQNFWASFVLFIFTKKMFWATFWPIFFLKLIWSPCSGSTSRKRTKKLLLCTAAVTRYNG
jgi:hypothetical protein